MSIFSNLTAEQFETIGQELDVIRNREMADLGEEDATYIRTLIKRQRRLEVAGRGLLMAGGCGLSVCLQDPGQHGNRP